MESSARFPDKSERLISASGGLLVHARDNGRRSDALWGLTAVISSLSYCTQMGFSAPCCGPLVLWQNIFIEILFCQLDSETPVLSQVR